MSAGFFANWACDTCGLCGGINLPIGISPRDVLDECQASHDDTGSCRESISVTKGTPTPHEDISASSTWSHGDGILWDGAVIAATGVRDPYGDVIVGELARLEHARSEANRFRDYLSRIRQVAAYGAKPCEDDDATRSGKLSIVSALAQEAFDGYEF